LKILTFLAPNSTSLYIICWKYEREKDKVMFLFILSELFCRMNDEIKQQFSWPRRLSFVLEKWIPNRIFRTSFEERTCLKAVCRL
jgi:hypothetical protein